MSLFEHGIAESAVHVFGSHEQRKIGKSMSKIVHTRMYMLRKSFTAMKSINAHEYHNLESPLICWKMG